MFKCERVCVCVRAIFVPCHVNSFGERQSYIGLRPHEMQCELFGETHEQTHTHKQLLKFSQQRAEQTRMNSLKFCDCKSVLIIWQFNSMHPSSFYGNVKWRTVQPSDGRNAICTCGAKLDETAHQSFVNVLIIWTFDNASFNHNSMSSSPLSPTKALRIC